MSFDIGAYVGLYIFWILVSESLSLVRTSVTALGGKVLGGNSTFFWRDSCSMCRLERLERDLLALDCFSVTVVLSSGSFSLLLFIAVCIKV